MRGRYGGLSLAATLFVAVSCIGPATPAFADNGAALSPRAPSVAPAPAEAVVVNRVDTAPVQRFLVVEAAAAIVAVRGSEVAVERADSASFVAPLAEAIERLRGRSPLAASAINRGLTRYRQRFAFLRDTVTTRRLRLNRCLS